MRRSTIQKIPKGKFKSRAKGMNSEARKKGAPGRVNQYDLEQIVEDFGEVCFYCKVAISFFNSANDNPDHKWKGMAKPGTFDHVVPLSKLGSNEPFNIVPACTRCNNKKGDREIDYLIDYSPNWE